MVILVFLPMAPTDRIVEAPSEVVSIVAPAFRGQAPAVIVAVGDPECGNVIQIRRLIEAQATMPPPSCCPVGVRFDPDPGMLS